MYHQIIVIYSSAYSNESFDSKQKHLIEMLMGEIKNKLNLIACEIV